MPPMPPVTPLLYYPQIGSFPYNNRLVFCIIYRIQLLAKVKIVYRGHLRKMLIFLFI